MVRVFIVLETYYKHAEATIEILYELSSVECYLTDQLRLWGDSFDPEETYESEEDRVYDLIDYTIKAGNQRLKDQAGWGILSVTEMTVDKVDSIFTFN